MKQAMDDLKTAQTQLSNKVDSLLQSAGGQVTAELPDDVLLPLPDVRHLRALEARLSSDAQLKQSVVCQPSQRQHPVT